MSWWEPLPETEFNSTHGAVYAEVGDVNYILGVSQGVRYGAVAEAEAGVYLFGPDTVATNNIFIAGPTTASGTVNVVTGYDQARDQAYIMIQSITQNYFRNNIKRFIPYEYWRKDAQLINEGGGEGNLENFVEVFALTLDEIKQAIDEFTELFDIDHCPPKYLRTIAEMLNYPLESVDTVAVQRAQLKSAIEWYKSKGARQGFIAILYAFGYHAEVIPLWTEHTEESTLPGVTSEVLSSEPNGILLAFSGQFIHPPHAGSIRITGRINGVPRLITDNGEGILVSDYASGLVDYDTGNWSLTFNPGPIADPLANAPTELVAKSYEFSQANEYEIFTETIPGVSKGNMPPNDYPLLVENGGTWFRSPHFGIRLKAIIGDKHAQIYWDSLTEGEVPITDELVAETPNSVLTEFTGTVSWFPLLAGTVEGSTDVLGAPVTITDDGIGGLSGSSLAATTVDHTPNGILASFGTDVSGTALYYPIEPGSVTIRAHLTDDSQATVVDDGLGILADVAKNVSGTITYATGEWHLDFGTLAPADDSYLEAIYTTPITGTIDYDEGDWTLTFGAPPTSTCDIIFDYTYDFLSLVNEIGYHRAFYQCVDILSKAGAGIQYHFDNDEFWYMFRRLEFLRPVFAVLDWIEHGLEMYEPGPIPTAPDCIMTVNPVRSEKGWYLGYCDLDDIQYTRLDQRLLGVDMLALPQQLPGSAATVNVALPDLDAIIYSVSAGGLVAVNGTLAHQWIYPGVEMTVTIGAAPYLVIDNGEGVLIGEDATVYGLIDYITGAWNLTFEGVNPDNPSDITVDYNYTTEVPPTDRSGVFPRGSTALPFPHLRDPQEGYCHPPEELFIDWYWLPEEPYTLPLTRNGMNLYPSAGPVPFIDHADFPSRGFTNALGQAGHANTFTRELGYALRPLSLLKVEVNPDPDAENWENQSTPWEVWTGPWENIGD